MKSVDTLKADMVKAMLREYMAKGYDGFDWKEPIGHMLQALGANPTEVAAYEWLAVRAIRTAIPARMWKGGAVLDAATGQPVEHMVDAAYTAITYGLRLPMAAYSPQPRKGVQAGASKTWKLV